MKRNKPANRTQTVLSEPGKVFVELYFTKSAMKWKKKYARRKKLKPHEEARVAAKYRYRTNPNAKPVKQIQHAW